MSRIFGFSANFISEERSEDKLDTDGNSSARISSETRKNPTESRSSSVTSVNSSCSTDFETCHPYTTSQGDGSFDYDVIAGLNKSVAMPPLTNLPFNPNIPFRIPMLTTRLLPNPLALLKKSKFESDSNSFGNPMSMPRNFEISAVNLAPPSNIGIPARNTSTKRDLIRSIKHGGNGGVSSKNIVPGLVCLVCGDSSSGKHYGILACNGCSGFFKRSVRRRLIYRCQAGNGNCVIDKAHRNQCQACRLKRCLQMGMNRDAVQNERQPRNSATLRPEILAEMDHERILRETAVAVGAFGPPTPFSFGFATTPQGQQTKTDETQCENQPHMSPLLENRELVPAQAGSLDAAGKLKTKGALLHHSVLSSPKEISEKAIVNNRYTPERCATRDESIKDSSANVGNCHLSFSSLPIQSEAHEENILDIAPRLLLMGVRWAKSLPGFNGLTSSDQMVLLRESWSELFLICAIQFFSFMDDSPLFSVTCPYQPHQENQEELNSIEKSESNSLKKLSSHTFAADLRLLRKIVSRFRALVVDPIEFACLKAILIFKSDTSDLEDPTLIEKLQDHALLTLNEHIHQSPPLRLGRLLLLMELLRRIPPKRMRLLYFKKCCDTATVDSIIQDIVLHNP